MDDLCLARLWPDYAALREQPAMQETAHALYQPLVDWIGECVRARKIGEDEA